MPKRKLDPLPAAAFQIMLALADGELHGYAIMRQVEEQSGGRLRLGPGTLYASIQALLEGKLIEEVARPDGTEPHQERRRYYRLTASGRKLARSEAEKMADVLRVARARKILRGGLCPEKMYLRLLRLYPSSFRKEYEDEALQLIRDRLRDETGFLKKTRLWWELVRDLAAGLPQAYRNSYAATEAMSLSPNADSIPSFKVLDTEPLRRGSILAAATVSLAAITTFAFLLSRPVAYRPIAGSNERMSPVETVMQRLNRAVDPDAQVGGDRDAADSAGTSEPRPRPSASAAAGVSKSTTSAPLLERRKSAGEGDRAIPVQVRNGNGRAMVWPMAQRTSQVSSKSVTQPDLSVTGRAVAPNAKDAKLDAVEMQRVIRGAITNLKQHYFDRDIAQKTADALQAHEKSGDDDAAMDGAAFAYLLTSQMREASRDMHLIMEYSQKPLPEAPPAQTADGLARFRAAMRQQNCMVRKVDILQHDIGYLKLDFFPAISVCESALRTSMASLNRADAIIFDLRDNTGGFPDSVSLIASYLFDHPEYMYGPRGAPSVDSWTRSPVAGSELSDKPVYVLTSGSTWSGAEQFSYDLKMLRRATLVGEATRGGAHAGVFHRIDDHFGIGIPEEKAINPFGNVDWEEIGVEPDVKVKAAEALETAVKLAQSRVEKK